MQFKLRTMPDLKPKISIHNINQGQFKKTLAQFCRFNKKSELG